MRFWHAAVWLATLLLLPSVASAQPATAVTARVAKSANVPEDTAMLVNAASGLIVISGCGHAGIANTLEYARQVVHEAPIEAAIGGFHLFAATDDQLAWTAGRLRAAGIRHLLGAHCTGIEAVFRLRQLTGLARRNAVVGAVGSTYTLGSGVAALSLAK